MPDGKVYIVGIGPDGVAGLPAGTRRILRRSEIIFGGKRLLEMAKVFPARKVTIGRNLDEIAAMIKDNLGQCRMAVLASGDPGFYGITAFLKEQLGKDAIEIIPGVSLMQVAFARIKVSWDDAVFASVHGRPIEAIVPLVRDNYKIGIFTDDKHTPAEIARVLGENGIADCEAYVCEDLGSPKEKVTATTLRALPAMGFSPLNILILIRDKNGLPLPLRTEPGTGGLGFGIPDADFRTREPGSGLITKLEIRSVSLAKLGMREDSVVWDIGAGSGAVSIEASYIARAGRIYAIEKNAGDIAVIGANLWKFRCRNIEIVHAKAPEGLPGLPDPDAVFIGGSGGQMAEIIAEVGRRLRPAGRVVIHVATLESLQAALDSLKKNGFETEITLVNVSRSQEIMDLTRLEALNPVFIVTGQRRENAGKNDG